jgi:hypothetical protein
MLSLAGIFPDAMDQFKTAALACSSKCKKEIDPGVSKYGCCSEEENDG